MKKAIIAGMLMVAFAAQSMAAAAAFVAPTEEQITQAANDPATLSALLANASVEQAAGVIAQVLAKVVALNPTAGQARTTKINAVVAAGFAASNNQAQLAAALGTAVAANTALAPAAIVNEISAGVGLVAGGNTALLTQLTESFATKIAQPTNTSLTKGTPGDYQK